MNNSELNSADLIELVNQVQIEFSQKAFIDLAALQDETELRSQIEVILTQKTQNLSPQYRKRLTEEYFSLGPLESLVIDPDVTEIAVNGPRSIWFEKRGCLYRHDDIFLSELTFRNTVRRLCRQSETEVTLDHPYASGAWRNFRVQVVGAPVSKDYILTLRARPEDPWTFERLRTLNWCNLTQLTVIEQLIRARSNFLVVGPTGAGKTSVLNACLRSLGPSERLVIMEDTDELDTPNEASVKLLTRIDPQNLAPPIDLGSLLRHSMRLRPDRLILGEVRGAEAKDLLLALATGHSGSLGTLHASQAQEALLRLEMLVQLGAPQWNPWTVKRLIQLSLQNILVAQKGPAGERYLEGIYRLCSLEDFGFLIEKIA